MKTNVGIWVDHHQAIIVAITANGAESTLVIASNVERQLSRVGGRQSTASFDAYQVPADDHRQNRYQGHLDIYYDAVVAAIRLAGDILIFGPGEAKGELRKRIAHAKLPGHVEALETTDKLTKPQIAAKVRQHFAARAER